RGIPCSAGRGRRARAGGRVRRRPDPRGPPAVPAGCRHPGQRGTMTHRGTESPGERGAGPDRRRVLGLAGLGSALALLGACGREEEGPGMDGTTTPEAGACQEGATARQRSSGASDGGGAAKTAIDPSVVAHGALALSPDGTQLAAAAGLGAARSGTTSTAGTALWSTADGTVSARFDNALTG